MTLNSINHFRVHGAESLMDKIRLELRDMQSMRSMDQIYLRYPELPKIIS